MNQDCDMTEAQGGIELIHQIQNANEDPLFNGEELKGIDVIKTTKDYVEVECGCTNNKYGDSAGKLRIFADGKLEVSCECYLGCNGEKMHPREFKKHAGLDKKNWEMRVWVFVNGKKMPLNETKLLKYYKGSTKDHIRPRGSVHRDEFIRCTNCNKERRFMRKTKDECWEYHKATIASQTWTCSDYPHRPLKCDDSEERAGSKKSKGCPRKMKCRGCISCVCWGCDMCRFKDCTCRSCVDFIQNAEA